MHRPIFEPPCLTYASDLTGRRAQIRYRILATNLFGESRKSDRTPKCLLRLMTKSLGPQYHGIQADLYQGHPMPSAV